METEIRILLVDDDAPLRRLLAKSLTRAGYQVVEASDGNEALQLFQAHASDLVITDLIMPGIEGLELIMRLRKFCPQVRVIAISGGGRNAPEDYLSIAKTIGACHVLAKPFLNEALLGAVAAALA